MAIQETNYEIIQGDTWEVDITVTDPSGTPLNFDGYDFIMEVRNKEGGATLCATATLGNGITVIDVGTIHVELTPDQTKNFTLTRSKYQLQSIDGDQRRRTLIQGWFQVKARTIA